MLNNNKNIFVQLMFWFVKTVHYYSAGPENKIGLSYVNVVCVYGGRGGEVGVRGFKNILSEGSEFFLLALCVCVCVCVWWPGSVPLLP